MTTEVVVLSKVRTSRMGYVPTPQSTICMYLKATETFVGTFHLWQREN